VQDILETSETADLDNYAKAILDGLKGPGGIMFNDTQVQSLGLSWLDTYDAPYFTVEARSSPDDFILKPVEFFEMPDRLGYPHSKLLWDQDGPKALSEQQSPHISQARLPQEATLIWDSPCTRASERDHYFDLCLTEMMSSAKKRFRMALRSAGQNRLRALRDWQKAREASRAANAGLVKGIDEIIDGLWQNYDCLIEAVNMKP